MCLLVGGSLQAQKKSAVPLIILDTDMGPDYDDVGALAILHALAARGECRILATVASDRHPDVAPSIAIFNRYFGRPDLPVGKAPSTAPAFTAGNNWNASLIRKFGGKETETEYPTAVSVYRKVLAQQKDHSVTIITIGFLSNLRELLNSGSDQYSALTGIALVRKKVKNWVAMAGGFPLGKEFNVEKDASASREVIEKWPSPILFSGYEIGASIGTGRETAQGDTLRNPVAWAYRYNLNTYDNAVQTTRPSWDQTAVLCAIRQPTRYFYVCGPGHFRVNSDGSNFWEPAANGKHHFLSHKYPQETVAAQIEELMQYHHPK